MKIFAIDYSSHMLVVSRYSFDHTPQCRIAKSWTSLGNEVLVTELS